MRQYLTGSQHHDKGKGMFKKTLKVSVNMVKTLLRKFCSVLALTTRKIANCFCYMLQKLLSFIMKIPGHLYPPCVGIAQKKNRRTEIAETISYIRDVGIPNLSNEPTFGLGGLPINDLEEYLLREHERGAGINERTQKSLAVYLSVPLIAVGLLSSSEWIRDSFSGSWLAQITGLYFVISYFSYLWIGMQIIGTPFTQYGYGRASMLERQSNLKIVTWYIMLQEKENDILHIFHHRVTRTGDNSFLLLVAIGIILVIDGFIAVL